MTRITMSEDDEWDTPRTEEERYDRWLLDGYWKTEVELFMKTEGYRTGIDFMTMLPRYRIPFVLGDSERLAIKESREI